MEWNTFVDDAKDMGTSIFETFSSAFNTAMGKLLFTATTLTAISDHNLHFLTHPVLPDLMTSQCDYCLRYLPMSHQIASQKEIVQKMNIGLHVMGVLSRNVDLDLFV